MPSRAVTASVALCASCLLLALGAGEAFAQNRAPLGLGQRGNTGNPVLRDPGAYTPAPRRAGPPPATWSPGVVVPPAMRPNTPGCITTPCNTLPIVRPR